MSQVLFNVKQGLSFDVQNNTNTQKREYEALAAGAYPLIVVGVENKEYEGKEGVKLEFQITKGPYERRRIWQNFWVKGNEEKKCKRDIGFLSRIANAKGLSGDITSYQQLVGSKVEGDVIVFDTNDGKKLNWISGFTAYETVVPAATAEAVSSESTAELDEELPF